MVTEKQKNMIAYQFMQYGIKGKTFAWEKLDSFIASGVIQKLIDDMPASAMRELEAEGFTFTESDWKNAIGSTRCCECSERLTFIELKHCEDEMICSGCGYKKYK